MIVRIGVNAHDPMVYFLSRLRLLEQELKPIGVQVEWVAYEPGPRGPWLLGERLDLVGCGQTPMLHAQDDGLDVVYVASSPSRPAQGALLVTADSAVASPRDLRGHCVAVGTGWPTQLVAIALHHDGASWKDVRIVDPDVALAAPGDALERLLDGGFAAWVALGPLLAEAEATGKVRKLVPTQSAMSNRALWCAPRSFAEANPGLIGHFVTAVERANHWVLADPARAARVRASERRYEADVWGGDARSWEETIRHRMPWTVIPIESDLIEEQQHAADILLRANLLSRAIDVRATHLPGLVGLVRDAVERAGTEQP